MNKFDINSAKFMGIIIGICFIFIMVIWHAFSYLPSKSTENISVNNEISVPGDEEVQEEQSTDEEQITKEPVEETVAAEDEYKEPQYDKQIKELELKKQNLAQNTRSEDLKPLDPIDEENIEKDAQLKDELSSGEQQQDPLEEALNKAKEYRLNHKPISAISEYQKAISLTNDTAIKAQCYENIAIIYASAKRYGSALSAAQKAYNTAPTVSREVLLARLYYKTGDIDKATNRVNNVLKREFSQEW